jgi:hypothetical protein
MGLGLATTVRLLGEVGVAYHFARGVQVEGDAAV